MFGDHAFTCESIRGSLTKCRHNNFRGAFAQMSDILKKSATPSAVNILDEKRSKMEAEEDSPRMFVSFLRGCEYASKWKDNVKKL